MQNRKQKFALPACSHPGLISLPLLRVQASHDSPAWLEGAAALSLLRKRRAREECWRAGLHVQRGCLPMCAAE